MSLDKASKLVEGSYYFQSYRSEGQLETWSTTPSNFYSFHLPWQSSKRNLLLYTLLPLVSPHPQSFIFSLYFHFNENRRVFLQRIPDRSRRRQQFASHTQMLGINTCQILLCPTGKGHVNHLHLQELTETVVWPSFLSEDSETRQRRCFERENI